MAYIAAMLSRRAICRATPRFLASRHASRFIRFQYAIISAYWPADTTLLHTPRNGQPRLNISRQFFAEPFTIQFSARYADTAGIE